MPDADTLLAQFESDISYASNISELEELHIKYLGRNGLVNQEMKQLGSVEQDKRREIGAALNQLKTTIEAKYTEKKAELLQTAGEKDSIDVTIPGDKYPQGSLHMVTLAMEEISRIFEKIGFIRMSYPEIEWEYFSFEALNIPSDHPARDDVETFFVNAPPHKDHGKMVLSPHTSSGQIREMWRVGEPPIRMINIAKCYRPNWDTTHSPMFHQFEGLCIDKDINITHLKGTIDYFAKEFFGENRKTRLRPFHFQFTEPSFEVDISCDVCDGSGTLDGNKCKVCKSGWLELGGAGFIHPNVLKEGKIDTTKYRGWAFGIGVERVMMMKGGINLDDLRVMYSGDVRFLEQF